MRTPFRPLTLVVALFAGLVLTACADETELEPPIGQVENNATVTAANMAIVTDDEGNAVLVGTLVNNGEQEDRLLEVVVRTEGGETVPVTLTSDVVLPVEEPVRLADDPSVLIGSEQLNQGFRAPLELAFAESEPIETTVTVEPRSGPYKDIEIPTSAQ